MCSEMRFSHCWTLRIHNPWEAWPVKPSIRHGKSVTFLLSVCSCSPPPPPPPPSPPPSPQQWESGGVWIPSLLRARGVNSSTAPGLRREGEIELCLPPPPRGPQGGLEGNEDWAAGARRGGDRERRRKCVCVLVCVCVCVCVIVIMGGIFHRHEGGDSRACSPRHLWWPQG